MNKATKRIFLTVLDSFGVGYLPDADKFGDIGANTLKSVTKSKGIQTDFYAVFLWKTDVHSYIIYIYNIIRTRTICCHSRSIEVRYA